jgi:hypothetical protein
VILLLHVILQLHASLLHENGREREREQLWVEVGLTLPA